MILTAQLINLRNPKIQFPIKSLRIPLRLNLQSILSFTHIRINSPPSLSNIIKGRNFHPIHKSLTFNVYPLFVQILIFEFMLYIVFPSDILIRNWNLLVQIIKYCISIVEVCSGSHSTRNRNIIRIEYLPSNWSSCKGNVFIVLCFIAILCLIWCYLIPSELFGYYAQNVSSLVLIEISYSVVYENWFLNIFR